MHSDRTKLTFESEYMASTGDRILFVENNPEISDIITRQALTSVGYQVYIVAKLSSAAINKLQAQRARATHLPQLD